MGPSLILVAFVAMLMVMSRRKRFDRLFQWLPIPLWCYGVPMILRTLGVLANPREAYAWITEIGLPVALGLLLLSADLFSLRRLGLRACLAMALGSAGIMLGGPLMLWICQWSLPLDAWKGIGALAATWTGGSFNMLSLQTILDIPVSLFAPLVVVDALVAYSWMVCLIACRSAASTVDRWLGAAEPDQPRPTIPAVTPSVSRSLPATLRALAIAMALTVVCRWFAERLPLGRLIATTTGWTVLLVTTSALVLSCVPVTRRVGQQGSQIGEPCLYVVLASLGAQANLWMLVATPMWVVVGFGCLAIHAVLLLIGGRLLRLPLGILATASQANVGGVVSAPLVGAVYSRDLAPVGLYLAIVANALGTYLGLLTAWIARLVVGA